MRILKWTLATICALIITSAVAGYFYFDNRFTPSPNYLEVSPGADSLPITWLPNENNAYGALLLETHLPGISNKCYMQFDVGAPSTIFYRKTLVSIQRHFPEKLAVTDSTTTLSNFIFQLGNTTVTASQSKLLNYGNDLDEDDSTAIPIIGTLGADFLEKKTLQLDFKNHLFIFSDSLLTTEQNINIKSFDFEKRKVLLPATVNGKSVKLLYDPGSSGFELITNWKTWEKLAKPGAKPQSFTLNSWGNALQAHTIESQGYIDFGLVKLPLHDVSYVEGATWLQNLLMRFTGMGGLVGNKLFTGKQLILDGKHKKFSIVE